MKIGIMSPTIFDSSTVEDPALTLEDIINMPISEGLEIRDGTKVFIYEGDTLNPTTYNPSVVYNLGDIVKQNGKLCKITGTTNTTLPKEPEEYSGFDDPMDFENAQHRYFRISNTHIKNKSMGSLGIHKSRWYYIFWEDRPHHPNCGFRFSAKDLNKTGTRAADWYLRQCLRTNTSYQFDVAKDKKADIVNWAAKGTPKYPTLRCNNLIIRGDYAYLRTPLDLPIEYKTLVGDYALTEVVSPADIDGFMYRRNIKPLAVFDKKDYTNCSSDDTMIFSFYNTEKIDSIALSKVTADTVDIHITDADGNSIYTLTNYPIYNELSKKRFEEAVTTVLYTSLPIESESLITLTLKGSLLRLGDISVADTLDFGYSNLQFNNEYKDFSPFEQDQWGNILYKDGIRVKRYSGSVDLKIQDYDLIYREMNFIGGREVVINGSDSINNTPTNSVSIFQSTMMVGRFKSIKLATKASTNKIDGIATYSFTIEERV